MNFELKETNIVILGAVIGLLMVVSGVAVDSHTLSSLGGYTFGFTLCYFRSIRDGDLK